MSAILGGPSTPPPKKKGRGKGKKQKGWEIEIEEMWQPTEEQKENLAKEIDWKTVVKNLMKPECTTEKAFKAMRNLKDLVGTDRFIDIMMSPAMIELGSAELYTKISPHSIKKVYR